MKTHIRVVAILHIIFSVLGLLIIAFAGLLFNSFIGFSGANDEVLTVIRSVGSVFAAIFLILILAELIAAIALLNGSKAARPWVIAFGALSLLNFPFGTALGIYTLWALLSKDNDEEVLVREVKVQEVTTIEVVQHPPQ